MIAKNMRLKPSGFRRADSTLPPEYYVIGGGHLGASVARRLEAEGHTVRLIDDTPDPDEDAGKRTDPADVTALQEAGVAEASAVVVATPEDSRNLLVAQNLRAQFDIPEIFVLVHTPDRCELFEEVGHEPICATSVLSAAILDRMQTPQEEATE